MPLSTLLGAHATSSHLFGQRSHPYDRSSRSSASGVRISHRGNKVNKKRNSRGVALLRENYMDSPSTVASRKAFEGQKYAEEIDTDLILEGEQIAEEVLRARESLNRNFKPEEYNNSPEFVENIMEQHEIKQNALLNLLKEKQATIDQYKTTLAAANKANRRLEHKVSRLSQKVVQKSPEVKNLRRDLDESRELTMYLARLISEDEATPEAVNAVLEKRKSITDMSEVEPEPSTTKEKTINSLFELLQVKRERLDEKTENMIFYNTVGKDMITLKIENVGKSGLMKLLADKINCSVSLDFLKDLEEVDKNTLKSVVVEILKQLDEIK